MLEEIAGKNNWFRKRNYSFPNKLQFPSYGVFNVHVAFVIVVVDFYKIEQFV
jgi:hypothetical protein